MKKRISLLTAFLLVGCGQTNTTTKPTTTEKVETTTTMITTVKTEERSFSRTAEGTTEKITLSAKDGMVVKMAMSFETAYPKEIQTENDKKAFQKTLELYKEQPNNPIKTLMDLNKVKGVRAELSYQDKTYSMTITFLMQEVNFAEINAMQEVDKGLIDMINVVSKNLSIDMLERELLQDGYKKE